MFLLHIWAHKTFKMSEFVRPVLYERHCAMYWENTEVNGTHSQLRELKENTSTSIERPKLEWMYIREEAASEPMVSFHDTGTAHYYSCQNILVCSEVVGYMWWDALWRELLMVQKTHTKKKALGVARDLPAPHSHPPPRKKAIIRESCALVECHEGSGFAWFSLNRYNFLPTICSSYCWREITCIRLLSKKKNLTCILKKQNQTLLFLD